MHGKSSAAPRLARLESRPPIGAVAAAYFMESHVAHRSKDEKPPLGLSAAIRTLDWVDSLPEFWQPVANGALLIFTFIGSRIVWAIPIFAAVALYHHSTFRLGDLRDFALLPLAVVGGALSGLSYSLIGRRISTLRRIGPYAAGFVAGLPYAAALILALRWVDKRPLLPSFDDGEWFIMLLCGGIGALIVGRALTDADAKDAQISGPREARRVGILIAVGIVLIILTWAMTSPPLCFLGGKYCK